MIMLDASGSMTAADAPGSRIDAAKRAVSDLVTALPSGAQVGLLVYGTGTGSSDADKAAGCHDIRQLVPVGPVNKVTFVAAVQTVRARGYTPIGAALQKAAAALPRGKAASIVLVSDGLDTCAPPAPCDVAAKLKAQDVDLVVHTIGFKVSAAARAQLSCIATATGGTYRDASDGRRLGSVLRSQVDAGLRPYRVTGIPVDGTARPTGAPTIAPGQYSDTFPAGGAVTKYYSIALAQGETVYITTTLVPPALRGGGVASRLTVVTRLENQDGSGCLSTQREADSLLGGKVNPVSALISGAVGGPKWSKRCPASGDFVVAVTRASSSTVPTRSETLVQIEAPVDAAQSPAPATVPPGLTPRSVPKPKASVGGAGFNDAALVSTGSYSDSLSTGETRYYKVHLTWGQRLAYQIVIDKVEGLDHGSGFIRSAVATPMRQEVALSATSNAARTFGGPVSITVSGSTLVPIEYGNRNSSRSDLRPYGLAGDYYLSLGMSYPLDAAPYRTDVTVTVDVVGAAEPGPHYLPLPASAAPPSAGPASSAGDFSQAAGAGSDAPGSSSAPWIWTVAGGVLLIAAGAAAVTFVRRRGQHPSTS